MVRAVRTVAVLSPDYLSSMYGTAEWQAAWADDPRGRQRKLITVRVRGDWPAGLLAGVVGIDLVALSEAAARRRLRNEIAAAVRGRSKPGSPPPFPLTLRAVPDPGSGAPDGTARSRGHPGLPRRAVRPSPVRRIS